MALLQSLTSIPPTFGKLSSLVLSRLLSLVVYLKATRVDFVADQYPELSIKGAERSKRAVSGCTRVTIYGKNQPTPSQWKKYLSNGKNKETLISFIIDCWKELKSEDLSGLTLFITQGEKCLKFHPTSFSHAVVATVVPELESDHEEADTRLLLHAGHASDNGYDAVAIKSPDTDVFVTMVGMQQHISADLFFFTGNQNHSQILAVKQVCDNIGLDACDSIIGFHACTGIFF